MTVSRDVILDLLPLYLEGAASPASRELVEAHLKDDPELARRVRALAEQGEAPDGVGGLRPEAGIESLRRTRSAIALQRWLFAIGIAGTAIGLSLRIEFDDGRLSHLSPMLFEYPLAFGVPLAIGLGCLIAYRASRRRHRTGG